MSDSIKITTIPLEDWQKYRDLRLEALKLYQKLGFGIVGKYEKELFVDNRYYDEYLMEMVVK